MVRALGINFRTDDSLPLLAGPRATSFNLLKATRLRDVVFRPGVLSVEWITLALQVVTCKHQDLRRISVDVPYHLACIRQAIGEEIFEQWSDLDRILVRLWESLSIRPNVRWTKGRWEGDRVGDCIGRLLPEMARRGTVTVDVV